MANLNSMCTGCMTDIDDYETCPNCGIQPKQKVGSLALPARTFLNKRFMVGRVLGRPGGFGITYLAWDLLLETTAAIKEFLPSCSVNRAPGETSVLPISSQDRDKFSNGLEIFLQEAKTLAQFSHPNISRIRDYFTANNTAYLVMDFHHGKPIDQYINDQGGSLTEDRALELMLPILNGLEAVHEKNFLHRDIKPQNIYLTNHGVPILLDFGAARYTFADQTSTLTVMLTGGFAPFEQYHKKGKQGPWSDIYACAATLYYLVTGKVPADAIERQHQDNLVPPIYHNPSLSESFSQALVLAMSIDHSKRPQNINTFRKMLVGDTFSPISMILAAKEPMHSSQTNAPNKPDTNSVQKTLLTNVDHRTITQPQPRYPFRFTIGKSTVTTALILLVVVVVWKSQQNRLTTGQEETTVPMANNSLNTNQPSPNDYIPPSYEPSVALSENPPEFIHENQNQQHSPNQAYDIVPHFQTAPDNRHSPSQPPIYPPSPIAHRPPEQAFHACQNKQLRTACKTYAAHGPQLGLCLPVYNKQLACLPHPPPFGARPPF